MEQVGPVSTFLCQKYIKFLFQNFGNCREGENGCRQTTFGFGNGKKNYEIFSEIESFLIFETKYSLSTSVSNIYTISQISKTQFYLLWT